MKQQTNQNVGRQTQLEKAVAIAHRTHPPDPLPPLEEMAGIPITFEHGMSTHVGAITPQDNNHDNWALTYTFDYWGAPQTITIKFAYYQILESGWDVVFDRPFLKVCPF